MWVEYYNIEKQGLTSFFHVLPGLIFFLFGCYWLYRIKIKKESEEGCGVIFFIIWTMFALLWTIGVGHDIWSKYSYYCSALNNHQYAELEGEVHDFSVRPTRQGEEERFMVDTVAFQYTNGGVNPWFNDIASRGGPISTGKVVKIHYFEGKILRLWLKEDRDK